MVATADGVPLDLANVARNLARPRVAADLARAHVRTPADLVALRQCSLNDLVAVLPPAPLNRDDRPYVEYRAPIDLYTVSPAELPVPETSLRSADPVKDLATWTRGTPPTDLAIAVAASLMASSKLVPATYWISSLMAHDPERAVPLFAQLKQAATDYNRKLELSQAHDAIAAGRVDDARGALDGLLRENPRWATAMVERARVTLHADSLAAARAMLEAALPLGDDDDRYNAYINLGVLSMREGKAPEGIADFARCNEIHPAETEAWLLRARALALTGQAPAASAVLAQARRVATDSTAVTKAQSQLQATGTIQ